MKRFPSILLSLIFGTSLAFACGGDNNKNDTGDSANDGGSGDSGGGGSGGGGGDGGADGAGDGAGGSGGGGGTGGDGGSGGGDAPADGSGGGGALGDDCTSNSDCTENYCLMIEGNNGEMISFCSRQCVSADDCPEDGWVCNLSPFTACVPDV